MSKTTPLLLLILLFASCSNNNEFEAEIKNLSSSKVSESNSGEEAAIKAFNDFIDNFQPSTRLEKKPEIYNIHKTNTAVYSREQTTRSNNEGIPIYELTLQNTDSSKGFAIVAENQLNHDILAYVPVGSIADTTFNSGLSIWFKELSVLQKSTHTRTDVWQEGWDYESQEISGTQEFYRFITQEDINNKWANCFYYGPIDKATIYSAFVPSAWSQTAPYNNKVPYYYNNAGNTERCRVGCFAVALGQLMSYHKHPSSYNWDLLTANPVINNNTSAANEVSKLLYDIALIGGTTYKTTSGAGSTDVSSNVPSLNRLGYNATSTYLGSGKSSPIIVEEMKKSRPVLFAAQSDSGGHIWVIDGIFEFERWYYYPSRVMPSNSPTGYELHRVRTMRRLIHCNWGWGGLSNGWYYNYTPQYTDGSYVKFNTYKYIYTEITPK